MEASPPIDVASCRSDGPPAVRMIPFTNDTGLRDYRLRVAGEVVSWPRWPWLIVAFLLGWLYGGLR